MWLEWWDLSVFEEENIVEKEKKMPQTEILNSQNVFKNYLSWGLFC